jgi:Uri superfamily endonuclease
MTALITILIYAAGQLFLINPRVECRGKILRGTYCLCIVVEGEVTVEVGALGRHVFTPGCYIYVGSAMNGIEARVQRHLYTSRGVLKSIHWHIDYLLKEPEVKVDNIYLQQTNQRTECIIATAISRLGKPVKGFGCSDCHCISHLFKVEGWRVLTELGLDKEPLSTFLRHGEYYLNTA